MKNKLLINPSGKFIILKPNWAYQYLPVSHNKDIPTCSTYKYWVINTSNNAVIFPFSVD